MSREETGATMVILNKQK